MSQAGAYVIAPTDLSRWVERLLARAEVVAPRGLQGGEATYDVVEASEQVAWDYTSSLSPLKRFLLPQTEPLLRWRHRGDQTLEVSPIYDEKERIFVGIRPCDVSGMLFLDAAFSRDRQDVYYLGRRERSAVVALSCTEPGENCFCLCAHAGPFLESGYDLQLTPLSGEYLMEVGTEKGAGLIDAAPELFSAAPQGALDRRRELPREVEQRFGEEKAYFAAVLRKVTFDRVADELWEQMAERCLSCGGCAFVCPTCFCFTTADCNGAGEGERDRLWDSCQYETYALEASGHNPRAERKHRFKARFFHKLSYQFAQRFGVHGCVGCGRCITACLGGNDMPAVTARIRRGAL